MKHATESYNRIIDPAGIIPDDEPVFLIRATDPFASGVVKKWLFLAKKGGVKKEILSSIRKHVKKMEEWPIKKIPGE